LLSEAVIAAVRADAIAPVVAVKEADEDPAGMETDAGTVTREELLVRETGSATGAWGETVTVQVAVALLESAVGEHDNVETSGAAMRLTDAD